MCTTTNRTTQTASPAAAELIDIPKTPAPPPPPPPGLFPPAHTLLANNDADTSPLAAAFKAVKAKTKYKNLPFAIIDYTTTSPVYFGHNDRKQTFVASHAKIGILFAALWLRKTARENAVQSTAADLNGVLAELTTKWSQEAKPFPDRFKKNTVTSTTWPPNLAKIFTGKKNANGKWILDFTSDHEFRGTARAASLALLAPIDEMPEKTSAAKNAKRTKINSLGFRDQLELMVGWSDNLAAAACTNAMGYQFVNGCLEAAGLYNRDKTTGGGLWISLNYDGAHDGNDFQSVTAQGSTAQVSANCFWLAANNRLLDADASADWQLMTDKPAYTDDPDPIPSYTRSFVADQLAGSRNLPLKKVNAKIGIYYLQKTENGQKVYYNFHYSDAANIHEAHASSLLKYVIAICFSGITDSDTSNLQALAFDLEKAIKSAH